MSLMLAVNTVLALFLSTLVFLPVTVAAGEDKLSARVKELEQRVRSLESRILLDPASSGWDVVGDGFGTDAELPEMFLGSSNISYGDFSRESRKVLAEGSGVVWGRVTANGRPCAGLRFRFFLSKDLHTSWTTSDESGIYRIHVPPGKYLYRGFEFELKTANRLLPDMIEDDDGPRGYNLMLDAQEEEPARGPDFDFVDAVIAIRPRMEEDVSAIRFEWKPYPGAEYYRLRLVHTGVKSYGRWEELFPHGDYARVDTVSVTPEALNITLKPGHCYHWEIRAYRGDEEQISHSPMIDFRIAGMDSAVLETEVEEKDEIITSAPPYFEPDSFSSPPPAAEIPADARELIEKLLAEHDKEVMAGTPPRPRGRRIGNASFPGETEAWDPGRMSAQGELVVPRSSMPAVAVGERIFVLGGLGPGRMLEMFRGDVEAIFGSLHVDRLPTNLLRRRFHTAESEEGRIYIMGGNAIGRDLPQSYFPNEVEIYDPATGRIEQGAPLPSPRYLASSVLLDGRIYLIGGSPPVFSEHRDTDGSTYRSTSNSPPDSRCFIYDIAANIWREASPMAVARQCDAVVWAGKIYAVGGYDGRESLRAFEVYDPAKDAWERLPDLPFATSANRMVVAGDMLFSFGDYTEMTRVYCYDFFRSTWKKLEIDLKPVRHAAVVRMDDALYVIGGNAGKGRADYDGGAGANPVGTIQVFKISELMRAAREGAKMELSLPR